MQWLKPYTEFNVQRRIETEKNNDKDGKALYKLMSNSICGKIMGNLKNRINVKLIHNIRDYIKCTSKSNYMSHKIFDKYLAAIRKSKVVLKLH